MANCGRNIGTATSRSSTSGPGPEGPEEAVALPLDALADFEGPTDATVTIEAAAPDRTVVRWDDRGIPQSREYSLITPVDRIEPMPAPPASSSPNPAGVLDTLAEAAETGTPDSNRYALECIQLRGGRGEVVATDGRQLLVRSGHIFPWADDMLIRARPIFACRALPRDRPVEVSRTDTHLFVRVGPWTISCVIQTEVRFPAVNRVMPAPGQILTRLRLDPADARFLESALDRLPGAEEAHGPVTGELNGVVAVRAAAAGPPARATELVLTRSAYSGDPVSVELDRALLGRALRLGHAELAFTGVETAVLCRDGDRLYAVQPLGGGRPHGAGVEVVRIESGAAAGGQGRVATPGEITRRTASVREAPGSREPAPPAMVHAGEPARPVGAGVAATEQPATSLASLIQEAESLHAALADARSRTARLVAGLRRQRKQSRLLQETLKSLRHLRLQDVAP